VGGKDEADQHGGGAKQRAHLEQQAHVAISPQLKARAQGLTDRGNASVDQGQPDHQQKKLELGDDADNALQVRMNASGHGHVGQADHELEQHGQSLGPDQGGYFVGRYAFAAPRAAAALPDLHATIDVRRFLLG
jgi:hypothetical protein